MTHSDTQSRVLVVEDEPELGDLYASWLSDSYDVTTAYNGSQALDLIDETIDVVLLDRRMPDKSGSYVLNEIREQGYESRVAMVTAVEPDLDIIEMGFDDYLTKPVTENEIQKTVDQLLTLEIYDNRLEEYYAAASKKAALDAKTNTEVLRESDKYAALETRLASLKEELTETAAGLESKEQDKQANTIFALLRDSDREEDAVGRTATE